jgi:hypothetical protein
MNSKLMSGAAGAIAALALDPRRRPASRIEKNKSKFLPSGRSGKPHTRTPTPQKNENAKKTPLVSAIFLLAPPSRCNVATARAVHNGQALATDESCPRGSLRTCKAALASNSKIPSPHPASAYPGWSAADCQCRFLAEHCFRFIIRIAQRLGQDLMPHVTHATSLSRP